jgi:hypothetical protein
MPVKKPPTAAHAIAETHEAALIELLLDEPFASGVG